MSENKYPSMLYLGGDRLAASIVVNTPEEEKKARADGFEHVKHPDQVESERAEAEANELARLEKERLDAERAEAERVKAEQGQNGTGGGNKPNGGSR